MRTHARRIICVDDSKLVLQILEWYLQSRGYTVFSCSNGREALDLLTREHIDAVVVDYHMPEMSGDELAAAVRSLAPRMPIAMFSGDASIPGSALTLVDRFIEKGLPGDFTAVGDFLESLSSRTGDSKLRIGGEKHKQSARHYTRDRRHRQAAA
jgi:CheY-like chemotaxis protein